ncbi:unnamed protein product [Cyclocybe aegerita]|uniref:Uncharacterized protein n=1 Tax=Cyclocybe aegerita TaxID=1973307 RepID=A0A8S0W1Q8_CYCAE|nr:unnamed protein product [Cyclocybe aegerita]
MTSETHLFPVFPAEIFQIIVEMVEELSSLCSLALSCSFLCVEAQRELFCVMNGEDDGTVHYDFLSTIIEYPHLGKLVKEYERHTIAHTQPGSFPDLLRRALPLMENLEDLDFSYASDRFPYEPEEFLSPNLPFKLDGFAWTPEFGEAHGLSDSFIDSVTEELGRITRFELEDGMLDSGQRFDFLHILNHMASVRLLDVEGMYNGELEAIQRLPHLDTLVLTLRDNKGADLLNRPFETNRTATVEALFLGCRTLRYLFITRKVRNQLRVRSKRYEVWIEGKTQSTRLSYDQVADVLCDYPDIDLSSVRTSFLPRQD